MWRLFLALFALGCSDGAREPGGESPERCPEDRSALRLWNFNLSHPDTVTLKNTSSCPLGVEGFELLFDDRDDAFPGERVDCTVRLPNVDLAPGASVRVSELPLAGEIDALAWEISACAYPLTFNPDRGAVIYLCNGPCSERTLLDVAVHRGDDVDGIEPGVVENRFRAPSPMRFGARFSEPLQGPGKYNDGFVRYQRTATTGTFPEYVSSDWGLQNRTLFADFEDGVRARNVAAAPEPWASVPGEPAEIVVTPATAASFSSSLRITPLGAEGPSQGLAWTFDEFSVPRDLTYFARTSADGATTANLSLLSPESRLVELGFAPGGVGASDGRGERAETPSAPNVWYRIELRDIDWTLGTFDLYVEGRRIGHALELGETDPVVRELRLYTVGGEANAHFDAIELWGPPYAIPQTDDPNGEDGTLRCGALGEGSGTPSDLVCEDIDGPSTSSATCASYCAEWNLVCCGESFSENYVSEVECLNDCATFSPEKLCCRAQHGKIGGPQHCRFALGVDPGGMPEACE